MAEDPIAQTASECTSLIDKAAKQKAYQAAYYQANKERKQAANKANHGIVRERNRVYRAAHLEENLAYQKAYYDANREVLLAQKHEYYVANKARIAERDRAYRAANAEKFAEKERARRPEKNAARAKRYKERPAFRLRMTLSVGVAQSLKTGKGGAKWEALVGYTVLDLARHLERQFTKGMAFDNYGEWHVDHIQPLASFNITGTDCPEFRAAWALTNLRPLWAKENRSKNCRRTLLL